MPGRHIVDVRDPTAAGEQRVQPGDAANRAIRVNQVAGGGGGGVVQQGARDGTFQPWAVRIAINDTPTYVDPRDRNWTIVETVPISAAALPLPTGAATEATLGTRLAEATFTGRINTQGQKTMAGSTPVVLASDHTAIVIAEPVTVDAVDLDIRNLVAATDKIDVGLWLGSAAPTVGQKAMASSIPVVLASDQSAVSANPALGFGKTLQFAVINQGAAGTTEIVAAVGGQRIKLVSYAFTLSILGTAKWRSGAATDMSGPMDIAATGGVAIAGDVANPLAQTVVGEALNIVTTLGAARGHISYFTEA